MGEFPAQDDMTKFFVGQDPWKVPPAQIFRWRACVRALRDIWDEGT